MTKEEIEKEHPQIVAELGMRVYRACVPALEVFQILNRILFLNYEMTNLKKKEEKSVEKPTTTSPKFIETE